MGKKKIKQVYLIQSLEDGYYKIGVSKHPSRRLLELQTGNPSELKLIDVFESEYPNLVEKGLHRHFKHLNAVGEWYNLSIEEELCFINECERFEKNIKTLKEMGNEFI